jgi:hypothetical protein
LGRMMPALLPFIQESIDYCFCAFALGATIWPDCLPTTYRAAKNPCWGYRSLDNGERG